MAVNILKLMNLIKLLTKYISIFPRTPHHTNTMSTRRPNQIRRISPDNPVRRRLPFTEPDDPHDQARVDNLSNSLNESIAKERKAFIEKYSFDTENDVPLPKPGTYRWHQNEHGLWIGVQMDKAELFKDEEASMKAENETTPEVKKKETAPLLKKRRNEMETKAGSDVGVKRRIFD